MDRIEYIKLSITYMNLRAHYPDLHQSGLIVKWLQNFPYYFGSDWLEHQLNRIRHRVFINKLKSRGKYELWKLVQQTIDALPPKDQQPIKDYDVMPTKEEWRILEEQGFKYPDPEYNRELIYGK